MLRSTPGGLDWDPFKCLAISGEKGPMDPHGKVTTHFRRGVRRHDPLATFLNFWVSETAFPAF